MLVDRCDVGTKSKSTTRFRWTLVQASNDMHLLPSRPPPRYNDNGSWFLHSVTELSVECRVESEVSALNVSVNGVCVWFCHCMHPREREQCLSSLSSRL